VPDHAAVSRSRFVSVNAGVLGAPGRRSAGPVRIDLFDGAVHTATPEDVSPGPKDSVVWRGRLVGVEESRVTLVLHGEVVAGTIRLSDSLYRIGYAGNGIHRLQEIDLAALPPEDEPIPVDAAHDPSGLGPSAWGSADPVPDAARTIDSLVAYTAQARASAGGTAAIEALIILAVEETNQAFANSLIEAQLRLVHMGEVPYVESGDMSTDLWRLRETGDGHIDEVHTWRDDFGADVVSLISNDTSYCGMAYLMTVESSSFESSAFSVVSRVCATGYYSFGHELGHNLGSTHDRDNAGIAVAPYGYGYQDPYGVFRTLMAYDCPNGCPRESYFSNPEVTYLGLPTGIDHDLDPAASADNARSINEVALTAANWRASVE
jgi:hypothetical protein